MNDPAPTVAATINGALLAAQALSKRYPDGAVQALIDVDLAVAPGEYVAIMGPSGSGKSTLLNILGALDRPDAGEVYFEGQPLSQCENLDRFRAQKLGFVFQSFHLLPNLTAAENVQIPMFEGGLRRRERQTRAGELLGAVGLSHRAKHLPKHLSVGERQRVAIARALANRPRLLLADEPTGNLDSKNAAAVLDLLDDLNRRQGLTIVMVTHDETLAQRTSRVVRMRDGRIESA
ncbi:MAG: ABC transporter ATP-binding protein [Pirellulales bacterium]|nr:ABC transporter ATP-binding protein [Pirellulales bacterium]